MDTERLIRFTEVYGSNGNWIVHTPIPNYVIRVWVKMNREFVQIELASSGSKDAYPVEVVFNPKENIYKPGTWETIINAIINHEGVL